MNKNRDKKVNKLDGQPAVGIVTRTVFDTKKLNLYKKALIEGVSQQEAERLYNEAIKPHFNGNGLWKAIKSVFGVDLKIPFLTGNMVKVAVDKNLIVTRGLQILAQQVNGQTTAPVTAIALGSGTTAPSAGQTALVTELTTNGLGRAAATVSNQTTNASNDTARWVHTFNATGSATVAEEGLFDNNSSGGNMLARNTFSGISLTNGDSLQITHDVVMASA